MPSALASRLTALKYAVTSVAFTADNKLVTTGRDGVVLVWNVADGKLTRAREPIPGRLGTVETLGVSPDGRCVLFDHGEELRLLDWRDGSQLGALRARRQGRFHGFALFAPSGRLVLTASNGGRLHLLQRRPITHG